MILFRAVAIVAGTVKEGRSQVRVKNVGLSTSSLNSKKKSMLLNAAVSGVTSEAI